MSGVNQQSVVESVPCCLVTTAVTVFSTCIAEKGASRTIHYPNLNACLVHEVFSERTVCNTVHFGYGIPVIVQGSSDGPCHLVFDPAAPLDPSTAGYLIQHHPELVAVAQVFSGGLLNTPCTDLEQETRLPPALALPLDPSHTVPGTKDPSKLAAYKSVKVSPSRDSKLASSSSKMPVDPNELYNQLMQQNSAEQDINAIAKQISDHAEAIYQTWKSKGLTPNELLQLHGVGGNSTSGNNKIPPSQTTGTPTSPVNRQETSHSAKTVGERPKSGPPVSPVDLLASPRLEATLEELVNSFVQEDKARLAAQGRSSTTKPATTSPIQNALRRFERQGVNYETSRASSVPRVLESSSSVGQEKQATSFREAVQLSPVKPTSKSNCPMSPPPTAEESSLAGETVKSRAKKFATRIEMANASGLTTWPLKRGAGSSEKRTEISHTATENVATTDSTLDVEKEEERLINALKTGEVIDDVPRNNDFLAKKSRERQREAPKSTRVAEEELESLVDRLKSLETHGEHSTMTTRENSPSRATSPRTVKLSDSVPVATMSTVDYAKVRYQAAQACPLTQQRLEDSRTIGRTSNAPQANIVSETRSRFENGQPAQQWRSEWSPARYHNTDDASETVVGNPFVQPEASPESPTELLPRKGRKLRKSPEPAGSSGGSAPLPHPQLTTQQRQHLRERSLYQQNMAQVPAVAASSAQPGVQYTASGIPIRPFLTRGSVAERVLIFEKCPTVIEPRDKTAGSTAAGAEKKRNNHAASVNAWRHSSSDVHTKTQFWRIIASEDLATTPGYTRDNNKENRVSSPVISPKSTLRRQAKATSNSSALLPRFYFPLGRPNNKEQQDTYAQNITAAFRQITNGQATLEHFGAIAKAAGLPLYWKMPLFLACGGEKLGSVTLETFMETWKKMVNNCHDEAARFVFLLTISNPGGGGGPRLPKVDGVSPVIARTYLVPEDFVPLIQDVVDTHPGLTFLKEASEFHSRYVQTVIARIFYNVNRTWSGRLSLAELRQSNFLATLRLLEDEEDINQITDYFSYEHFYVIYCKFWELDKDHDLHIDKKDLARHNDHAISTRMIDRIFSGAVTRGPQHNKLTKLTSASDPNSTLNRMSYAEFVWFLMSEEDKRHPTAVEYWFRCMDLDGDGYLSMYELEYFYEEQLQRMEALGIETLPFEDCLCQMLDMVRPSVQGKISLSDLKRCHMTPIFFDTFFNLEKYLDHEQRDPFASQRDPDSEPGEEVSDWDRYAAEEYELLVAEEGGPDQSEEMLLRDDTLADEASEDHVDSALESNLSASYAPLFTVPQCAIINPVVANAEYQY